MGRPVACVLSDIPELGALTAILDISETVVFAAPARRPSILAVTCAATGSPARNAPPAMTLPLIATSAQTATTTRPQMVIPSSAPSAQRTAPRARRLPLARPASWDLLYPPVLHVPLATPLPHATNAILITTLREEESAVPARSPTDPNAASAPMDPFAKLATLAGEAPSAISAILAIRATIATAASQRTTTTEQVFASHAP